MIFASKGVAWLLATSSGGDLSYQGTWSYRSNKLSLAFDTFGFDRKGTFNAELRSDEITIPFQVFTSKPGTSTWEQAEVDRSSQRSALHSPTTTMPTANPWQRWSKTPPTT